MLSIVFLSISNELILFTIFPIETDFSLVLLLSLQSLVYSLGHALTGLGPMEKVAGTGFLHHLSPNKAGQLAKPIRAVHNRVAIATLSISQQEVTVCTEK